MSLTALSDRLHHHRAVRSCTGHPKLGQSCLLPVLSYRLASGVDDHREITVLVKDNPIVWLTPQLLDRCAQLICRQRIGSRVGLIEHDPLGLTVSFKPGKELEVRAGRQVWGQV